MPESVNKQTAEIVNTIIVTTATKIKGIVKLIQDEFLDIKKLIHENPMTIDSELAGFEKFLQELIDLPAFEFLGAC